MMELAASFAESESDDDAVDVVVVSEPSGFVEKLAGLTIPEGVGLETLDSLVGALTISDWENSVSEEQRQMLRQLLPRHAGIDQEANLKELFGGGNFKFGNPISRFRCVNSSLATA
jgi:hypothetical protein